MEIENATSTESGVTCNTSLAPISIAAITGGQYVPSRRFRIEALKPYLASRGVVVNEFCPRWSRYPPAQKWKRPAWLIAALIERLFYISQTRGFDAIVLQRELISTVPTIEHLLPGPKILDVDDAIFLHRGGRAAQHAAKSSMGVVCGNQYLADHFSLWNKNVTIIPTGVDTAALKPFPREYKNKKKRKVGWIGTSQNMKYLHLVANGIRKALKAVPKAEFHVISNSTEQIPPELRPFVRFTKWRPGIECEEMPTWDIGIMPLMDDPWARGKCAFKALQYMSAGLPVIASPVGMNKEVVHSGKNGILAEDNSAWQEALMTLLNDEDLACQMGTKGRQMAEAHYSLEVIAEKWRNALTSL